MCKGDIIYPHIIIDWEKQISDFFFREHLKIYLLLMRMRYLEHVYCLILCLHYPTS